MLWRPGLVWIVAAPESIVRVRKKMDDRLELLLKQITDGQLRFRAAGKSLADIESFQRTVRDLHELEANGYIDILDERSEFHTGALLVDLVFVRTR